MPTIAEALQLGWQRQQAGDVLGAEQIYLQVLQVAPRNENAWCFLGMARHGLQMDARRVDQGKARPSMAAVPMGGARRALPLCTRRMATAGDHRGSLPGRISLRQHTHA